MRKSFKSLKKQAARGMTLKEESAAENKKLGLEESQAQMDFIFTILNEHGINSRLWLQEYIAAAQTSGMNAPDLDKWLPWNLSSELKDRLSRDSYFEYGQARFVQTSNGTVFYLPPDGTRQEISIGDLTAAEFEKLTGLSTS